MVTSEFYTQKYKQQQDILVKKLRTTTIAENDEHVLYNLVKNGGLGLPGKNSFLNRYRPLHGIHLSYNRGFNKSMRLLSSHKQLSEFCRLISIKSTLRYLYFDCYGRNFIHDVLKRVEYDSRKYKIVRRAAPTQVGAIR
jgi:hypothetical protein